MRALWEWIINPLLPNFVIAAIKSSRCKPDTGLAYWMKVKWIIPGSSAGLHPKDQMNSGSRVQGSMAPAPTAHPQLIDTGTSCYHPGPSSRAMPSLYHMCEQFLRVHQTFLFLLLHLILRTFLWTWHLLTLLQMRISNHLVVNRFDQGHTTG